MYDIPLFKPYLDKTALENISDALDVGWLGMGKLTQLFEERIAHFLALAENRHVVATNTGTSALHLALRIAGVGPGDEVITPSFNYVADHQAIHMTGANVVMCDICSDDLGIDCKKAEALIGEKTKAIMPLHFSGVPCAQKQVISLCKKYDLRLIEDATHAFGTVIDDKKIGAQGDIACFSFDPVKIITSIDGGAIVVNSEDELDRLRHMRFLGVDKEVTERYKNKRAWSYDVISEGYRYHLNSIMASVGLSQLEQIDDFIRSRQQVCQKYNEKFSDIEELEILNTDFEGVSPFIYTVRVKNNKRLQLIEHMRAQGIDVGIHFIPVHEHNFFSEARCGDLSVTRQVTQEIVTLPLHSHMPKAAVEHVINSVSGFFVKSNS